MIFLILVIIASTFNQLLFKAFARFRIDLLSVIVINFALCSVIGYCSSVELVAQNSIFGEDWFSLSVLQGFLFVACLLVVGQTTRTFGVVVTTLATRLSVAIPTIAAFFLYNDLITTSKIIGILISFLALYLSCFNSTKASNSINVIQLLPLTLFIFFGAHSVLIKFVQEQFLDSSSYHVYIMSAFLSAFIISGSVLIWRRIMKQQKSGRKELISGLILGLTNYGSIYFLIKVLSEPNWQSSQLFPTISISVVCLSSLGAWIFFNERPNWRMTGALAIGVISIILINLD